MKIAIVGDGKVGRTLTEQLSREGHDIVVIDRNREALADSEESLDVISVHGNGASLEVQKTADIGNMDLLIAATSADEINMLCCIVARKLGCRHTIARVRNPEYVDQVYFLKDELGLNMTTNPESMAAREIFKLLQLPSFVRRDAFAKGRAEIVELLLKEGNILNGKRLIELNKLTGLKVLVCAVERGDQVYIPAGNFRLEKGDKVYVTAPTNDLAALISVLGLETLKIKNVMIIGGSRIAFYLAQRLTASGIKVKILEQDYSKAKELAERLPKAEIVCVDGSSKKTLLAEGIEQTDALVALTNVDEANVLISMCANLLGVPKVVTKINRTEYAEVFKNKGLDCVVSPKDLTANEIIRYVRSMQNTMGSGVLTLHRIVDNKVEALEFLATERTDYLGKKLSEIKLRPNILIACINRKGQIIIPRGDDTIELDDTVIIVTTADRMFRDLNDIFETAETAPTLK